MGVILQVILTVTLFAIWVLKNTKQQLSNVMQKIRPID